MIAQSVADILGRHVRLAVEGIDRMYLNIYVPQLQASAVSYASFASTVASRYRRRH